LKGKKMTSDYLSPKEMDKFSEAADADDRAATAAQRQSPVIAKSGFSPRPGVVISEFSYRDVLQAKNHLGHIVKLAELAKQLGYEYILWNDRVYFVGGEYCLDTGITAASVH
jgi:hypothetical protein